MRPAGVFSVIQLSNARMGRNFKTKKQIVIVHAVVGRKANCNFHFFMVR